MLCNASAAFFALLSTLFCGGASKRAGLSVAERRAWHHCLLSAASFEAAAEYHRALGAFRRLVPEVPLRVVVAAVAVLLRHGGQGYGWQVVVV